MVKKLRKSLLKRHDVQNSGTESLRNFLYKFNLEPCFIASFESKASSFSKFKRRKQTKIARSSSLSSLISFRQ